MSKLYIAKNDVAYVAGLWNTGYDHLYLVYDPDDNPDNNNEFIIRAGPTADFPAGLGTNLWTLGILEIESNFKISESEDNFSLFQDSEDRFYTELDLHGLQAQNVWAYMQGHANKIAEQEYTYSLDIIEGSSFYNPIVSNGLNSNSVIGSIVTQTLGLPAMSSYYLPAGTETNVNYAGVNTALVSADSGGYTINGLTYRLGTGGDDTIAVASSYDDYVLDGGDGEDTLTGSDGGDILWGGDGEDTLTGGLGSDTLHGNAGEDILDGGSSSDIADYSTAAAGVNVDLSSGIASDDGDGSSDTLIGIEDIRGSAFNDTLTGAIGDNGFYGSTGSDVIDGIDTSNYDFVDYSSLGAGIVVTVGAAGKTVVKGPSGAQGTDTLINIDMIKGTDFNDHFIITDRLAGFAGRDVRGGKGNDRYTFDVTTMSDGGSMAIQDSELIGLDNIDIIGFNPGTMTMRFSLSNNNSAPNDNVLNIYFAEYDESTNTVGRQFNITIDESDVLNGYGVDTVKISNQTYRTDSIIRYAETQTNDFFEYSDIGEIYNYSSTSWQGTTNGAAGGALPTMSGGQITGVRVSPLLGHIYVPYAYGEENLHPWVILSAFGGGGAASISMQTFVKDIVFHSGISMSDVRLTTSGSLNDASLVLTIDSIGESFTIPYFESGRPLSGIGVYGTDMHSFVSSSSAANLTANGGGSYSGAYDSSASLPTFPGSFEVTYYLETIAFASGGSINAQGSLTFTGTGEGDGLYGLNTRADTLLGMAGADGIYGFGGNDTLHGGEGADYLYGGDGNDTYFWNIGDGDDAIYESSGSDTLEFGAEIEVNDVRLFREGNDLYIYIGSEMVRLHYGMYSDTDPNDTTYDVETLRFADDTEINLQADVLTFTGTSASENVMGTRNADILKGMAEADSLNSYAGNDILSGGTGADYLYGGDGDDTYFWNIGDGNDSIYESSGLDTLEFGENIDVDDVRLFRLGHDLYLYIEDEMVRLHYGLYSDTDPNDTTYDVEKILFADNTEIDLQLDILTFTGTSDSEYVYGTSNQDILKGMAAGDGLYGYAGDDVLYGGEGDDYLNGGDNDDTYVWNIGDGNDSIYELSGSDILEFGMGIEFTDVRLFREGHDLQVYIEDEMVRIHYGLYSDTDPNDTTYDVEKILFADDTEIDLKIDVLTFTGTSNSEYVYGTRNADILKGLDHSDILYGNDGNDRLYGGAGADVLYGQGGADQFVFEAASAYSDIDTAYDFSTGDGDALNLVDLLSLYDPLTDAITDFVEITSGSYNSEVSVDRDGLGSAYSFTQIATLNGVTGLTDEAALVASGNLIVT